MLGRHCWRTVFDAQVYPKCIFSTFSVRKIFDSGRKQIMFSYTEVSRAG